MDQLATITALVSATVALFRAGTALFGVLTEARATNDRLVAVQERQGAILFRVVALQETLAGAQESLEERVSELEGGTVETTVHGFARDDGESEEVSEIEPDAGPGVNVKPSKKGNGHV